MPNLKPHDSPEAYDYRLRRAVMKLKKIQQDNADVTELAEVFAALDKLAD